MGLLVMSGLLVALSSVSGWTEVVPLVADATADPAATRALGSDPALGVSATKATYVRFDLSRLPAGTTVHRATLSVYVGRMLANGSIAVHRVTGAWDEDTLTAARQPTVDAPLPEGLTLAADTPFLEYLTVDVTAAVQAWLAGQPNHGLALRGDATVDVELVSKESQAVPRPALLEVVPGNPPD
jgi:hypothetical protein